VTAFEALIAAELAEPVDPRVSEMAAAIAAHHGAASRAVLFYGSCLREQQLDGLMLDFYLIVSDYQAAYPKRWLALANRLIPPNVFPFAYGGLAAKYAVLSETDFEALCRPSASTVSVWARFAQPSRLTWVRDVEAAVATQRSVALAAPALFELAQPLADSSDTLDIWRVGFAETYKCELRAERGGRAASIVDSDPDRYRRLGDLVTAVPASKIATTKRWRALQRRGKLMSVIRLAKAAFTFSGGIDYLAWKINRHAGTEIEITPWQRRHPLLAAIGLVPQLLRQGAIK
jgi:hypothetical protein